VAATILRRIHVRANCWADDGGGAMRSGMVSRASKYQRGRLIRRSEEMESRGRTSRCPSCGRVGVTLYIRTGPLRGVKYCKECAVIFSTDIDTVIPANWVLFNRAVISKDYSFEGNMGVIEDAL